MASKFITGQYLEWCTMLPTRGKPRESPLFLLEGNEWIFRFALEEDLFYRLYLNSTKIENKDFKSFFVNFQIGFEKENFSSLYRGEFRISKRQVVCAIPVEAIDSNLPRDYVKGNWLKFLFCFQNLNEPLSFIKKEKEKLPESIAECHQSFQDWEISSDSKHNHLEALSRDFSKLLDKDTEYDVEIKCDNEVFQAYRNVLTARSDVFEGMIISKMDDEKICTIEVGDMKASVFQMFLRYLYTGVLPDLNVDTAKQLYEAGERYDVEELQKSCSNFLFQNLTPSNAGDILVFADQHKDPDFQKNIMTYIIDNDFPEYDIFWSDAFENHAELAAELLILQKMKNG